MHLACIVGIFMVLFAAAERRYEMNQAVSVQENKNDVCNPSMDGIKCCICLEMITKYMPMINALVEQKINVICRANWMFRGACRRVAKKVKDKVIKGFFPGSPRQSCMKYKVCKYKTV